MSDLSTAEAGKINRFSFFLSFFRNLHFICLVIYSFSFLLRHVTPEKFYVEACDDGADDVLVIDRVSTEVTLSGISQHGAGGEAATGDCTAVAVIKITDRGYGRVRLSEYRPTKFEFLPPHLILCVHFMLPPFF